MHATNQSYDVIWVDRALTVKCQNCRRRSVPPYSEPQSLENGRRIFSFCAGIDPNWHAGWSIWLVCGCFSPILWQSAWQFVSTRRAAMELQLNPVNVQSIVHSTRNIPRKLFPDASCCCCGRRSVDEQRPVMLTNNELRRCCMHVRVGITYRPRRLQSRWR